MPITLNTFQPTGSASSTEEKVRKPLMEVLNYPSAKRKYIITFLDTVLDFSPKKEDGRTKNENCAIMFTYSLPVPFNGRYKVMGNKELIKYTAKQDQRGADGNIVLKAGQQGFMYDKFGECVLRDASDLDKAAGGKRFRRSVEFYSACYIWKVIEEGVETEINDIALMGFNMLDLFFPAQKGFGKQIMELDKKNKLETAFLEFSDTGLIFEDKLDKEQMGIIKEAKEQVNEFVKKDNIQNLFPIPYQELLLAVQKNEYSLPSKISLGNGNMTVDAKSPANFIVDLEEEDSSPPF